MGDLVFVAIMLAAFGLAVGYLHGCAALVGSALDGPGRCDAEPDREEPLAGPPTQPSADVDKAVP